jgi:serine O-acetyltransferase
MRQLLRADAERLRRYQQGKFGYRPFTWFLDPGWACVLLYRLSRWRWLRGSKLTARLLMQLNSLATGADIHPEADLGGGLLIPSPCGVNLSLRAGENLAVMALVGMGGSVRDADVGAGIGLPLVGRNVTVNWFSGVQGSITVGDGVVFGPGVGAVVSVAAGMHMSLRLRPKEAQPLGESDPAPRAPRACGHGAWRQVSADLSADIDRYIAELMAYAPPGHQPPRRASAFLTNPLLALTAYRVSHWLHVCGWRRCAMLLCQANILLNKLTMPPGACVGGGVLMPHLGGTLFHGQAGARLTQYAGSLCTALHGSALAAPAETAPLLGDDVLIAGHAGAFGPIEVGDGAQLGPKAQLVRNLDAGCQVWDPLARGSDHAPDDVPEDPHRDIPAPAAHPLPQAHPWRETRRRLRMDRERLGSAPRFPAMTCAWLYRMSHACHATGRRRRARLLWLANIWLTGADITPCCEIGGGLLVPHPAGVTLHCRAGENLTVGATAGIAAPLDESGAPVGLDRSPRLGERVRLDHHTGVFGAVKIGDGVRAQPGCVTTQSAPPGLALVPRKLRFRTREAVQATRARANQE